MSQLTPRHHARRKDVLNVDSALPNPQGQPQGMWIGAPHEGRHQDLTVPKEEDQVKERGLPGDPHQD